MPSDPRDVFPRRLLYYLQGHERRAFAREHGFDETWLSKLLSGDSVNVQLSTVWKLSQAIQCDPAELVSDAPFGATKRGTFVVVTPPPPEVDYAPASVAGRGEIQPVLKIWESSDEWTRAFASVPVIPVPKLSTPVAAGSPILGTGDIESVSFLSTAYVSGFLRGPVPPGRLVFVEVAKKWLGESMLETIRPGATLTVDRGQYCDGPTSFENGAIYLVRHEGGITCKRVWLTGNTLNCHADNHGFPPFVIRLEGEGFGAIKPHLAGKVVRITNSTEV